MIPLKLKLINFMPYHEEEVDLAGIHLVCLCGENGAGKSSLLAALTWALWGKARDKVSDDELISSGKLEMSVDFEFALGDHTYRALRKRSKQKGGESRLYFQVCNPQTGMWMSLDEPSIRLTQKRIDETLSMDYDTFINSAYLVQGRADEFARRPPNERKKVLAEILGLSYYDGLETKAKEESKHAEMRLREIDNTIRLLDQQLAEKNDVMRIVREASEQVIDLDEQFDAQEQIWADLDHRFTILEERHKELEQLEARIAQVQAERQVAENALKKAEVEIARLNAVLATRAEVERGYADWQLARAEMSALSEKQTQFLNLSQRQSQARYEVQEARNRLQQELNNATRSVRDAEAQANRLSEYEAQLEQQRTALDDYGIMEQQSEAARQRREDYKRLISNLESDNQRLEGEMKALRDKLSMLKKSDHQRCPVCDSELGANGYQRIEQHYTDDGLQRKDNVARNQRRIEELRLMLGQTETELTSLEHRLKGRTKAQREEALIEERLNKARNEAEQLVERRQEEAAIIARLNGNAYAQPAQQELASVEAQMAVLGYDAAAYDALRRHEQQLAAYEPRERAVREAEGKLLAAQKDATHAQSTRNDKTAVLEEYQREFSRLAEQLRDYDTLVEQRLEARYKLDSIKRQREDEKRKLDQAEMRVSQLMDMERQREDNVEERKLVAEEKGIYDELVQAFGKKGVQAMIIDTALPELTSNANELLGRMTDGRMSIKLDTQRPTAKGDSMVETLNLEVADGGGYRSYELYSGGEAFRINFALRVAMSKLLAHRAGAQLQTLIIDEGFGTLDGNGRERLIQAIRAVQSDFECILVITHLEELKDEFPCRLEVSKGQEGSHVELIVG